jgi:hypothetical protein
VLPLHLLLLFLPLLLACGSDKGTGPDVSQRLAGGWLGDDGVLLTFEQDGQFSATGGNGAAFAGTWQVRDRSLVLVAVGGRFQPQIDGAVLRLEPLDIGLSDLGAYSFTTSTVPATLVGTEWVDVDGCLLVLASEGTYSWGDASGVTEAGTWRWVEGVVEISLVEESDFSLEGERLIIGEQLFRRVD